jgi:transcriptional regulator with XRE-family HTH domain
MESIGNRVRGHAARLGIDMQELAARTGTSQSRALELDADATPTVCELVRVEMALGLMPGELLCDL